MAEAGRSIIFVATNTFLSRQNVCPDKHTFVATKDVFCRNKHVFVATKVCLSGQNGCRDKLFFIATNICRDESFVATKIFYRDQQTDFATKLLLRQAYFCRNKRVCSDKTIIGTKTILVASPANDGGWVGGGECANPW